MAIKIVELIDVQTYRGQQCLTRYHFLDADGVADESVLVADYITDVLPLFVAFQSTELQHIAIRHRQVYPTALLLSETAVSPAATGTDGATAGPSYATFSLKFNLGDTTHLAGSNGKHIKKGGKHLPGVTQDQMVEDDLAASGVQTAIAAWFAEVKDPGTDPWQLVVASFETTASHRTGTTTTETITKAGHSTVITKYCSVLSASAASISTQNTRKVLRGRVF